jgi:hypothetical protein
MLTKKIRFIIVFLYGLSAALGSRRWNHQGSKVRAPSWVTVSKDASTSLGASILNSFAPYLLIGNICIDGAEAHAKRGGKRAGTRPISAHKDGINDDAEIVGQVYLGNAQDVSSAAVCNAMPSALSCRRMSRTLVKLSSFWALLSQPGLKVRMFWLCS